MGPSTFRFGRGQVLRKLAVIGGGDSVYPRLQSDSSHVSLCGHNRPSVKSD
jgi:hypothetical protein